MKAKKKPARTRGRKRRDCARQPNGQPSRVQKGPTILEAAIEQRAMALGVPTSATVDQRMRRLLLSSEAGHPLGRLLLTERITERLFKAGSSYAILRRRWDRLADAPGRHPRTPRLPIADECPKDLAPEVIDMLAWERESDVDGAWLRAKLLVRAIRRRMERHPDAAELLAVLEAVCVDEAAPAVSCWLPLLRRALEEVAAHFRLEPDEDGE